VARAKQTDRAEARRRARLASRAVEVEAADDELDATPSRPGASDQRPGKGQTSPPRRPSIFGSFRAAYRRPDYRADLVMLPKLIVSVPFIGALGMIVAGELLWLLYPGYSGSAIVFQYLTVPPAVAPIFAVGFFAKRASYALGFLIGLADSIVFLATYRPIPTTTDALYLLVSSALLGAVLAAGLAWYRRFLALTQPRRGQVASAQASKGRTQPKPARRRY
jgi:hypothetical protein